MTPDGVISSQLVLGRVGLGRVCLGWFGLVQVGSGQVVEKFYNLVLTRIGYSGNRVIGYPSYH